MCAGCDGSQIHTRLCENSFIRMRFYANDKVIVREYEDVIRLQGTIKVNKSETYHAIPQYAL